MRLYYKTGACSLSSRIVLTELGLPHESVKVDTDAGLTETGADYRAINPKGYVPSLQLDGGAVITENPAILQYLADNHAKAQLAPAPGTLERASLQEWLNFTSSELHKAFSPYFTGLTLEGAAKERVDALLARRVGDVERGLIDGRPFILGETFTVADAYQLDSQFCFFRRETSILLMSSSFSAHVAKASFSGCDAACTRATASFRWVVSVSSTATAPSLL